MPDRRRASYIARGGIARRAAGGPPTYRALGASIYSNDGGNVTGLTKVGGWGSFSGNLFSDGTNSLDPMRLVHATPTASDYVIETQIASMPGGVTTVGGVAIRADAANAGVLVGVTGDGKVIAGGSQLAGAGTFVLNHVLRCYVHGTAIDVFTNTVYRGTISTAENRNGYGIGIAGGTAGERDAAGFNYIEVAA